MVKHVTPACQASSSPHPETMSVNSGSIKGMFQEYELEQLKTYVEKCYYDVLFKCSLFIRKNVGISVYSVFLN